MFKKLKNYIKNLVLKFNTKKYKVLKSDTQFEEYEVFKLCDITYLLDLEPLKIGDSNFWFFEFGIVSYDKPCFCDCGVTNNFILTKEINFPFPENCKKIVACSEMMFLETDNNIKNVEYINLISPYDLKYLGSGTKVFAKLYDNKLTEFKFKY